jgi:hypothetical protein
MRLWPASGGGRLTQPKRDFAADSLQISAGSNIRLKL